MRFWITTVHFSQAPYVLIMLLIQWWPLMGIREMNYYTLYLKVIVDVSWIKFCIIFRKHRQLLCLTMNACVCYVRDTRVHSITHGYCYLLPTDLFIKSVQWCVIIYLYIYKYKTVKIIYTVYICRKNKMCLSVFFSKTSNLKLSFIIFV